MDPNAWHQRALPANKKAKNRTWEENYQALLLYKQEHGDVQVPHKFQKDRVLAKWCSHLREYYNAGQLSPERVEALEAIGFVWNPHEKKWNETYQRLVAFWKENGHSKVPTIYKKDPALGKWVSRQREDYSGGYIPENRRKKLEALAFVWRISKNGGRQKRNRPDDDRWEQRYAELVDFHKEHGHSNVPRPDGGSDKLAGWVGVQRCNYGRGLMPQERIDRLRKLDFVFNFNQKKKQEEWNRMYELLKVCQKKDDGGFQVSIVGDEASSLSRWIQRQREKYKLYKLEPGREILLRKLDFRFPDRAPRPGIDDSEQNLKKTLAEIENATAQGTFGAAGGTNGMQMQQAHMKGDTSMVAAIVDLAGDDKTLGKKVAESIGVLSHFMSISPEELSTRISAPMSNRSTPLASSRLNVAASKNQDGNNAFGTLMPLIVILREYASDTAMQDCANFISRMVRQSKTQGWKVQPADDPDMYYRLLTVAADLDKELDKSERSKAVVESCAMYLKHIIAQESGKKKEAAAATAAQPALEPATTAQDPSTAQQIMQEPAAKRARTSKDWDREAAAYGFTG